MKKKLILTETQFKTVLQRIVEDDVVEKIYLTPEEYMQYLKQVGFMAHAIPYLPKFTGKKIVVKGNLNLSDLSGKNKIYKLGNIEVTGNLDASKTGIKNFDDVVVGGRISFWDTPYEKELIRKKQLAKRNEQDGKRDRNEWSLDGTDEEGEKANAAFEYAVNEGYLEGITDDEQDRISEINREIEELEEEQENLDAGDENYSEKFDEITDKQMELEDEKNEILSDRVDVYDLYNIGRHYDLTNFESLSTGHQYAVGTEDECDESLKMYYEEMVDSMEHYFDNNFISRYVDGDEVAEYFEDSVSEWVRDEPDSYGVEKQLSKDQEKEIWVLEMEKWVYENEGVRFPIKYPTMEENGKVFDFWDENEEHEFQYRNESSDPSKSHWVLYKDGQVVPPHQIYDDEETQDQKDDRESRISDIDYEIEEIKDNPDGEPSEEDIEYAIESYIDDNIKNDPVSFLQQMGYDDYSNFVNKQEMLDDLVSDGEYGSLNGYDGSYDSVRINGTYYIVMRID